VLHLSCRTSLLYPCTSNFLVNCPRKWIYVADKIAAEKMTEERTESIEVDSQIAEKAVILVIAIDGVRTQSNKLLARGPPELVQHFRGSSHRRKSADMVWLYRSPIPVVKRGVIFLFK
jgi:hypothetical protein